MHLVITNNSPAPTVVMSRDEGGWVEPLPQSLSTTINHHDSDVMIIGDKPTVTEEIVKGLKVVAEAIERWKIRPRSTPTDSTPLKEPIAVVIANNGNKIVRVLSNSGKTSQDVNPGVSCAATSIGYVEIREMGNVSKDVTNPKEAP
jgi:hypothetical protein